VSVSPGTPLVVAICGEVDIQSAPELREKLLQVIRMRGPQVTIDSQA
jgi:anti-anti-sigma regulatory factor